MTESADGVLLIHAFPLDAGMWERQVGTLENAGWPVAAPSLPGFGGADGVGPTMTMGAAADRCLQAADAAGIERFVACGLSMGGYVAFELWRMARQRIAGLVLANTRSGADTPEAAQGRRALADRLDAEGNGFLVEQPPPLLSDQASDELWDQVRGAIRAQPAASIGAAARAIDVPMLIVTSSLDTLIPAAVSTEMRDHHPDAGLVEIPGSGHLSNLEAPEAFDQALLAFLATFDRA
jgi:pimeloyl-ACP methyl ester carboxylesterase